MLLRLLVVNQYLIVLLRVDLVTSLDPMQTQQKLNESWVGEHAEDWIK